VHFDAPFAHLRGKTSEDAIAEAQDRLQRRSRGNARLDLLEPAFDIALQWILFETLVMGLVFGADDHPCARRVPIRCGEYRMTPPAIASIVGKIGIDGEIVPAVGEGCPVVERAGLRKAVSHRLSRGENKSFAIELVAKLGQAVGSSDAHASSVAKRGVCSRANSRIIFRATAARETAA